MESRTFNSLFSKYHEQWAAKVLNMKWCENNGPDLIDDEKAVETKFNLIYPVKKLNKFWKVNERQISYEKDWNEIYWGLGFYGLKKSVKEFNGSEVWNFDNFVDYREIHVVDWNWMKQFPVKYYEGKTHLSYWSMGLVSPSGNKLPKAELEKEVEGGKIYFTEGINPERFSRKMYGEEDFDNVPF